MTGAHLASEILLGVLGVMVFIGACLHFSGLTLPSPDGQVTVASRLVLATSFAVALTAIGLQTTTSRPSQFALAFVAFCIGATVSTGTRRSPLVARLALLTGALLALSAYAAEALTRPVSLTDPGRTAAELFTLGALFACLIHGLAAIGRLSAYVSGWLLVAGALVVSMYFGIGHLKGADLVDKIALALFVLGALMTLYRNLWHPAQWVAAGAGLTAVASVLITDYLGYRGEPLTSILAIAFLVGALTVLLVPRLIGRVLKGAGQEEQGPKGA